jgi:hypothetical protein
MAPKRRKIMLKWNYTDNRGMKSVGTVESVSDHGGTDTTYFFRNENGSLDVISGTKLKRDKGGPIYGTKG